MNWLFELYDRIDDGWKEIMDWSALGSIAAAFLALIPKLSTVVGFVWLCLRVWEMDTVKGWTGRKKDGDERKHGLDS